MAKVTLFEIPKVVVVTHYPDAKACVAAWISASSPRLREAVTRGLDECGRLGVKSWIADLSGENPGIPSQADLAWIATDGVEIGKRNGVVALITVLGPSHVSNMGARRMKKIATENGISNYECATVNDALVLAAVIASGKAA